MMRAWPIISARTRMSVVSPIVHRNRQDRPRKSCWLACCTSIHSFIHPSIHSLCTEPTGLTVLNLVTLSLSRSCTLNTICMHSFNIYAPPAVNSIERMSFGVPSAGWDDLESLDLGDLSFSQEADGAGNQGQYRQIFISPSPSCPNAGNFSNSWRAE